MSLLEKFKIIKSDPALILKRRKSNQIYCADFNSGYGKYISAVIDSSDPYDVRIQVSPKIEIRLTYIFNKDEVSGIQISKLDAKGKRTDIHLSTLDWEGVLAILHIFSETDLKAIANRTIMLDESIIGDSAEVSRFLQLIASDPEGKEKMAEVAKNYGLIKVGDIDNVVQKKEAVQLFEKILNNPDDFDSYKSELGVGKPEEVWQKFFSNNSWILGSDFVEILDERQLDVNNITDYLLKSFDGFVDIIELKLPNAPFWTEDCIPRSNLTIATMQCNRYILQTERKIDSVDFQKKVKNTPIIKPRITLVYGRSNEWGENEKEAYRVLNSSYHNLNIITYDHLLERAKRLVGISKVEQEEQGLGDINLEEIPF